MIGPADLREAAIRAGISEIVIDELLGGGHVLLEDPEVTLRLVVENRRTCFVCNDFIEPCGGNPNCVHVRSGVCVRHLKPAVAR